MYFWLLIRQDFENTDSLKWLILFISSYNILTRVSINFVRFVTLNKF